LAISRSIQWPLIAWRLRIRGRAVARNARCALGVRFSLLTLKPAVDRNGTHGEQTNEENTGRDIGQRWMALDAGLRFTHKD
jgi:hypothetical protein